MLDEQPATVQQRIDADEQTAGDTESIDLAGTAELLQSISAELDAVEATLQRLTTDAAGTCEVCGTDIDLDTLRERPTSTRCVEHCLPP